MITVHIADSYAPESLLPHTAAIPAGRFERLYRSVHGPEVPSEVACDPLWAGVDAAEAHEALLADLDDEARDLDTIDGEAYVLVATGDGCDTWARCRVLS